MADRTDKSDSDKLTPSKTRTAKTQQVEAPRKVGNMDLEDGKVYLMDTRNGRVHQYEDSLAQMPFMQRFVQGEKQTVSRIDNYQPAYSTTTTAMDRAAEWDRRAQMTNEEREAADREAADATGTASGVVTTASGQPASTPQTLTTAVPEHGATRTNEQAQTDATATPAATATASGVVGATSAQPAARPAPPPPPSGRSADSGQVRTSNTDTSRSTRK